MAQSHETIASFRKVEAGSNRKFGLTIGVVLLAVGLLPLLHHRPAHVWLVAAGVAFVVAGALFPSVLEWPNRAWFKLGVALNAIVSPVVMAALFFGAVVPTGWFLRRKGEDILALRLEPGAQTYWITRDPSGPRAGTLDKQY